MLLERALRRALSTVASLLLLLFFGMSFGCTKEPERIVLWHAYRGDEAKALEDAARAYEKESGEPIDVLRVPFAAYASKLEAAIPHGHGPDLFIDAHERLGSYARLHMVAPVGETLSPADELRFSQSALKAMDVNGLPHGVPLAAKALALILNEQLSVTPLRLEDLFLAPKTGEAAGIYPLAYEGSSAFVHAPLLHACGGTMLNPDATFGMEGAGAEESLRLAKAWTDAGYIPADADGALVAQLFTSGKARAVISGPWFLADVHPNFPVRVVPLPKLSATNGEMRSFLTVDAAMLTPSGVQKEPVRKFARWLGTSSTSIKLRAEMGGQVIPERATEDADPIRNGFRRAAENAVPLPTSPEMRSTWGPAGQALRSVLRGSQTPHDALVLAAARFRDLTQRPPPPKSPVMLLVVVGVLALYMAVRAVRKAKEPAFRQEVKQSASAYGYVSLAALTVLVLVILPLVAGAVTSLFVGSKTNPEYGGLSNYISILTARGGDLLGHGSFYLTLLVTILWTVVNVAFHCLLGVGLGLLLSRQKLFGKPLYRVLLVLPWAVPSYITALSWKGMFHRQYGAINAILSLLHVEPIAWFSKFSTAFTANVLTNVWLGFPFMMVVTMGAITSISKDVLEAAEIDGATRWQRVRYIVLPLLRPALLPSVSLGAVWTFNMFNVVFLVSGGEPDETTDILVSEAYRWAFTREAQYGYAAAYSVLIFVLLFGGGRLLTALFRAITKRRALPPAASAENAPAVMGGTP